MKPNKNSIKEQTLALLPEAFAPFDPIIDDVINIKNYKEQKQKRKN